MVYIYIYQCVKQCCVFSVFSHCSITLHSVSGLRDNSLIIDVVSLLCGLGFSCCVVWDFLVVLHFIS